MTKRGNDFVDQWIETNIHPKAYLNEKGDPRPKQFADACALEAKQAGISRNELEDGGGGLEDRMAQAIDAAADSEVNRLVSKDA